MLILAIDGLMRCRLELVRVRVRRIMANLVGLFGVWRIVQVENHILQVKLSAN